MTEQRQPRAWYDARPHVIAVAVATLLLWVTDITKYAITNLDDRFRQLDRLEQRVSRVEAAISSESSLPNRGGR